MKIQDQKNLWNINTRQITKNYTQKFFEQFATEWTEVCFCETYMWWKAKHFIILVIIPKSQGYYENKFYNLLVGADRVSIT